MNEWVTYNEECDDGDGLFHNGCNQACEIAWESQNNLSRETATPLVFYPAFSPGYNESSAEAFAAPMTGAIVRTYYYKFTTHHTSTLTITTGSSQSTWDARIFEWRDCDTFSTLSLTNEDETVSVSGYQEGTCAEIKDYVIEPGTYYIAAQSELIGVKLECNDCEGTTCGDLLCTGIETIADCPEDCDPTYGTAPILNSSCFVDTVVNAWNSSQSSAQGNNSLSSNVNLGPGSCGGGGLTDVYLFTAGQTGSHIFKTEVIGQTDTVLYARSQCRNTGNSNELACNDDQRSSDLGSRIRFDLEEGEEAYVIVDSYNGNTTGQYNLLYSFCPTNAFCEF